MKRLLSHPFARSHGPKFMRFLVCGGLGACIDFGTLYLLVHFYSWEEKYALLVSTGLAMIFVFFANRFFTFKVRNNKKGGSQAAKFLIVYLTAAGLNYGISLGLIEVGVHYIIAKALAIGCVMFFNYFSLNSFVFKQSGVEDEVTAV